MSFQIYNQHHIGCHADGSFGHDHVRSVLARIVEAAFGADTRGMEHSSWDSGLEELVASLRGPMPDDCWDEDAALVALNEGDYVGERAPMFVWPCRGVYFTLRDGDLMCADVKEYEPFR